MDHFYSQYPPVKLPWSPKIFLWGMYGSFLPLVFVLSVIYFQDSLVGEFVNIGANQIPMFYVFVAVSFVLYLGCVLFGVPFLRNKFQKEAYLRKHGKKGKVLIDSIARKIFLKEETSRVFEFKIEGHPIMHKQKNENGDFITSFWYKLKEGDTIDVIYNPSDPTDYVLESYT